jgi:hypothetical protein
MFSGVSIWATGFPLLASGQEPVTRSQEQKELTPEPPILLKED